MTHLEIEVERIASNMLANYGWVPLADEMASHVAHMRGRPLHHVMQALVTAGFKTRQVVENIDEVMGAINDDSND